MNKVIPIWFDRRTGVIVPHEGKGFVLPEDVSMELLAMTGIRLYEDRWKGKTAEQVLEEYTPGLWH